MENSAKVMSGDVGSVEVLFAWRDATGNRAVIDAELVETERCPAVWIGAHQGLRFVLPAELASRLGEDARFRLVGIEDGRFVLRVPEGAEIVATHKGELVEIAQGIDRVRTLALTAEHVAEIKLGDFSFYVRPGAAPEKPADRGPLSMGGLDWIWRKKPEKNERIQQSDILALNAFPPFATTVPVSLHAPGHNPLNDRSPRVQNLAVL